MGLHEIVDCDSPQTVAGPKTLTAPILNSAVCGADPVVALAPATKQYVDKSANRYNGIMNGNFQIWNRGIVFSLAADGLYTADRWRYAKSGVGINQILQAGGAPSVAQAGVLISNSLQIGCTTIDASIAASDFYTISHRIEGYRWRQLAQKVMTLSFWVLATKAGTYCVSLRNNANVTPDRSYVAEFSVPVASVWYFQSITIAASPSAGTWNYTTGPGLQVSFVLAAGSTYQTTPNGWRTGNFLATSNQVNGMDNVADALLITGVRLEEGTTPSAIQIVSYDEEYGDCERHLQMSFPEGVTPVQNAGIAGATRMGCNVVGAVSFFSNTIPFRSRMRPGGIGTLYNPSAANAQVRNVTDAADFTASGFTEISENGLFISGTANAGAAVGKQLAVHWMVTSELE